MSRDKPIEITSPAEEPLLEATLDDAWASITNNRKMAEQRPQYNKPRKSRHYREDSKEFKTAIAEAFRKANLKKEQ